MRIAVTIPEDIYNKLVKASEESMRPLATEALYRIKIGLEDGGVVSVFGANPKGLESKTTYAVLPDILRGSNNIGNISSSSTLSTSSSYEEAISKVETINAEGYQPTSEDISEMKKYLKERNLQFNPMKKTLEKWETDRWVVVHKFN